MVSLGVGEVRDASGAAARDGTTDVPSRRAEVPRHAARGSAWTADRAEECPQNGPITEGRVFHSHPSVYTEPRPEPDGEARDRSCALAHLALANRALGSRLNGGWIVQTRATSGRAGRSALELRLAGRSSP